MKYQRLEQIALEADVHPGVAMPRRERLEDTSKNRVMGRPRV
jgi:hypothetical protein